MNRHSAIFLLLHVVLGIHSQTAPHLSTVADAWRAFHTPQDSCRTKVWWFHGETETTKEGITRDLEAFKKAGVGGVVYYDQVHKPSDKALPAMSPEWWQMLKFAATEAKRIGLTFEINISNGYVLGGKWIDKSLAMQRLVSCRKVIREDDKRLGPIFLPSASKDAEAYDVAVFAIRLDESKLDVMRSITYNTKATGKSRNGAMNTPDTEDGVLYVPRPNVGVLEASDDSVGWRTICSLPPVSGSPTYTGQSVAFAPVKARFFRTRITDPSLLKRKDSASFIRDVDVSPIVRLTNWEERAGLRSEFIEPIDYTMYEDTAIRHKDIIDLTDSISGNSLMWKAPKGCWMILRIMAEATGGKSKHGRKNLLGLEADKLSPRGVMKHWETYTQPVIDTLAQIGVKPVGVCMDSHEAGSQNWTQDFAEEFSNRRGYSLRRWLPVMVGYVMESAEKTDSVLADVRKTISELVCKRYFGTIQSLCHKAGVTLTAQAMGNGLSMVVDNFKAKRYVDKPQTEFWARDKNGSYDIKEGASAAHYYGKNIASAEAFTDMKYSETLADIKPLADYAYSCHINEFVVCASAYQPSADPMPGSTGGGRHYCLNRGNTLFAQSNGFWDYQARCAAMMRQGKAVVDVKVKLPDIPPTKLLSRWLPKIPAGYSWEVTTERVDTSLTNIPSVPDIVDFSAHKPDNALWFSHRQLADGDIYFLANHSDSAYHDIVKLRSRWRNAYFWNPLDGTQLRLHVSNGREVDDVVLQQTAVPLHMAPQEAGFIVLTDKDLGDMPYRRYDEMPIKAICINTADLFFEKENIRLGRKVLFDWTTSSNPRIKYFSGICDYTTNFSYDGKLSAKHFELSLPPVNGNVGVYVNDKYVATMWCQPWKLDITDYVKSGNNKILLKVDNVLSNRMIGDAGLPEKERVTFAQPQIYTSQDQLKSSGIYSDDIKINVYDGM